MEVLKLKFNFNIKHKNILKKVIYVFLFILIISLEYKVLGATKSTPTLVNKLNSALKNIQNYLVKLATPAAGVAICAGVLIRKFSFGDEEKFRMGKKVIINAIVCYGIIYCTDLIIKFIEAVLK